MYIVPLSSAEAFCLVFSLNGSRLAGWVGWARVAQPEVAKSEKMKQSLCHAVLWYNCRFSDMAGFGRFFEDRQCLEAVVGDYMKVLVLS